MGHVMSLLKAHLWLLIAVRTETQVPGVASKALQGLASAQSQVSSHTLLFAAHLCSFFAAQGLCLVYDPPGGCL